MWGLAAVAGIALFAVGADAQVDKNVKQQFEGSYTGKMAILRKPLYSIAATVNVS